jgi:hypothetical protein
MVMWIDEFYMTFNEQPGTLVEDGLTGDGICVASSS